MSMCIHNITPDYPISYIELAFRVMLPSTRGKNSNLKWKDGRRGARAKARLRRVHVSKCVPLIHEVVNLGPNGNLA